MNRRNFLSSIGAVVGACSLPLLPEGMSAKKIGGKYVLLFDPARVSLNAATGVGQYLNLPRGTRIIPVHCRDGQTPEDAFAIVEVNDET